MTLHLSMDDNAPVHVREVCNSPLQMPLPLRYRSSRTKILPPPTSQFIERRSGQQSIPSVKEPKIP